MAFPSSNTISSVPARSNGSLRAIAVVTAYEDLGMVVVGTGYEFGHNDDYQRTTHYVKEGTLILVT
ncbi:MAG: nitrogenase molybdenum-iron protein alpha chain [Rhodospirillaceae bacterium]|nr:MAG: nitrogenase molybdenum-iron protein alpha chain [Rhodospirillaceae bacterium]